MAKSSQKIHTNIHILFMEHEAEVTLRAVDSVLCQLRENDHISILLNGATRPDLKRKFTSIKGIYYYESATNLGVAGGRNFLLQTDECKSCSYIVYVDNDAIVPADYVSEAVAFLEENSECGVMGAVVLKYQEINKYHPDRWQRYSGFLGGEVWSVYNDDVRDLLYEYHREAHIDHIGTHEDWHASYLADQDGFDVLMTRIGAQLEREFISFNAANKSLRQQLIDPSLQKVKVGNIPGCCQAFRRALIEEIGGLNDLFNPYGYEDTDFCIRAIKAGYTNYLNLKQYMFHGTDRRHAQRHVTEKYPARRRLQNRAQTILDYLHAPEDFPYLSLRRMVHRGLLTNPDAAAIDMALCADGIREACIQLSQNNPKEFSTIIRKCNEKHGLDLTVDKLTEFNPHGTLKTEKELTKSRLDDQKRLTRLMNEHTVNRENTGGRTVDYWRDRFNPHYDKPHTFDDIAQFKDLHKGKRCFIIGNGPSLNKTDMSLLKNEYTFGVNGLFYLTDQSGFKPTYYVVEDNHVVEDNLERINAYRADAKFFPDKYDKTIIADKRTFFMPTDWLFYWESSPHYARPRFSHDLTQTIYTGQTVTYLNMQLAHYMGFDEIYIIGLDFSYQIPKNDPVNGWSITSQGDDPNHFHPDYFGKGKKWHFPKLHNCLKSYQHCRDIYEKTGRKIQNATIGGMLEVYDRVEYLSLFEQVPHLETPNETAVSYWHQVCRTNTGNCTSRDISANTHKYQEQITTISKTYCRKSKSKNIKSYIYACIDDPSEATASEVERALNSNEAQLAIIQSTDNIGALFRFFASKLNLQTYSLFLHGDTMAICSLSECSTVSGIFGTLPVILPSAHSRFQSSLEEASHTLVYGKRENIPHYIHPQISTQSPSKKAALLDHYTDILDSLTRKQVPCRMHQGRLAFEY